MFKRRRRRSPLRTIGLILAFVGMLMLLYIIPLQIWYFIVAALFLVIGLILFKIS